MPAPMPIRITPAAIDPVEAIYGEFVDAVMSHDQRTADILARLLRDNPEHVRGWAAKAILTAMLARREFTSVISDAAANARRFARGDTTDGHFADAAERIAQGHWHAAIASLELALQSAPHESLAAKLSHALRFMLGDAEGMLSSMNAAVAGAGSDHRHFGYLLGCRAFALEENHEFAEAERLGREALERTPNDSWGMHAVSHVYEMTGNASAGLAWIDTHPEAVWNCNNFRYHLLWHKALFQLELGNRAAALEGYDHFIRADHTDDFRDIANAASLLKRFELAGMNVGDRWQELADLCARRIEDRSLVFADMHYVLALAGAGRPVEAQHLANSLLALPGATPHQTRLAQTVGAPVAEAIIDHANAHYAQAAEKLLSVQTGLQAIGGSHAQRDVFDQLLLDALVRSGHSEAMPRLIARLERRGGKNTFAEALLERRGAGAAFARTRMSNQPQARLSP